MSPAATAALGGTVAIALTLCGIGALAVLATPGPTLCAVTPADARAVSGYSAEQIANAATIVTVGARLHVPSQGWVIAVATAIQESSLRNLDHGDRDSLGLFQQRPSQGWGTPAQVMDPTYAAAAFYRKLLTIPGWQQMPLTDAAQRVQVSAYPNAYAKHEADARALVTIVAVWLHLPVDCDSGWVVPLPPGTYRLSSPYGPRWGTFHYGQDFAAPTGTPIRAAAAGTVLAAGCTSPFCDRPGDLDANGRPITPGCGLRVVLIHSSGVATMYCHASVLIVHTGQAVTNGQVIGYVGSTGHSTGPHLHFQIHLHAPPVAGSTAVEPVAYLTSMGVTV